MGLGLYGCYEVRKGCGVRTNGDRTYPWDLPNFPPVPDTMLTQTHVIANAKVLTSSEILPFFRTPQFTNLSILTPWTWALAAIDTVWGCVACAVVCWVQLALTRRLA